MFQQEMQVPEEVLARVDALAAKFNVAAELVWASLVQQAHLQWVYALWCAMFTAIGVAVAMFLYRKGKAVGYSGEDPWYFSAVVVALFALVASIGFMVTGVEAVMAYLNPEYWAWKRVFPTP